MVSFCSKQKTRLHRYTNSAESIQNIRMCVCVKTITDKEHRRRHPHIYILLFVCDVCMWYSSASGFFVTNIVYISLCTYVVSMYMYVDTHSYLIVHRKGVTVVDGWKLEKHPAPHAALLNTIGSDLLLSNCGCSSRMCRTDIHCIRNHVNHECVYFGNAFECTKPI